MELAAAWQPRLAAGYAAGGLRHEPVPRLAAAYYAHLLKDPESQAGPGGDELERLAADEQGLAWAFLRAAGVPEPLESQGPATRPLRQGLEWLSARSGRTSQALARLVVAFASEVYVYLSHPGLRRRCRDTVAEAIREHQPRALVAHSLGSVVTYEALHAHPDLRVDLLVTLGSPLGLPGAVFDALDPEPQNGLGARPDGVGRWVNLADAGDLVAVPPRLGDRFPVDQHEETYIGAITFHTLSAYLSCGLTAAAIAPYTTDNVY